MPSRPPRIFVADDQRDVVESLRLLLKGEGYAAETFDHPDALIAALRTRAADAVLMDLNYTRDTTSGDEGLDAVAKIRAFDAHTPIVVMTAWGSIASRSRRCAAGRRTSSRSRGTTIGLLTVLRTQVALGQALNRTRSPRGRGAPPHGGRRRADRRIARRCSPCSRRSSAWRRRTRTC